MNYLFRSRVSGLKSEWNEFKHVCCSLETHAQRHYDFQVFWSGSCLQVFLKNLSQIPSFAKLIKFKNNSNLLKETLTCILLIFSLERYIFSYFSKTWNYCLSLSSKGFLVLLLFLKLKRWYIMQICPYRKSPSPLQSSSLPCIFILKRAGKFSNERLDERKKQQLYLQDKTKFWKSIKNLGRNLFGKWVRQ